MSPAEVFESIDSRLWEVWGAGVNPWIAGAGLVAGQMGVPSDLAVEGVVGLGAGFTRVLEAEDPRRFRVAKDGERAGAIPALVLHREAERVENDDLIALSLKPGSKRFWRMTCLCDWLGDRSLDGAGTLRLRQSAHGYVAGLIKAAAYRRRCDKERQTAVAACFERARSSSGLANFAEAMALEAEDARRQAYLTHFKAALRTREAVQERWSMSMREPDGALILDPAALDWTRKGMIGDAEYIEILDAPADGPLGRALVRLNPRIGTKHGVRLEGVAPERPAKRRAA